MAITQKEQKRIAFSIAEAVWEVYKETIPTGIPSITDTRKICNITNEQLIKLNFKNYHGPLQINSYEFLTIVYGIDTMSAVDHLSSEVQEAL